MTKFKFSGVKGSGQILLQNVSSGNFEKIDRYLKQNKSRFTPDVKVSTSDRCELGREDKPFFEEVVLMLPDIVGYKSENVCNFYAGLLNLIMRLG